MQGNPVLKGPGEASGILLQQAIQGAPGGQFHHQHAWTDPSRQQRYETGVVEVAEYHQLLQKANVTLG